MFLLVQVVFMDTFYHFLYHFLKNFTWHLTLPHIETVAMQVSLQKQLLIRVCLQTPVYNELL